MRVAKASIELATAPQFDFIIENNNLQKALDEAYKLVSDFVNADK
jgi:guanylate kinase